MTRRQIKCDGNNLSILFFSFVRFFFVSSIKIRQAEQSTNYAADFVIIAYRPYITATLNGKNGSKILCFESQTIRSRGCRSAKRKNNCALRLHYFTQISYTLYFVYLVYGSGQLSVCSLISENSGAQYFHYSEMP